MRTRARIALVAVTAALVQAAPTKADVGPSFLKPSEITPPTLRFENLDAYPDYDFYAIYGLGYTIPRATPHVVPVSRTGPTRLEGKGRSMTSVVLAAVPHGQHAPVIQWDSNAAWDGPTRAGELRSQPFLKGGSCDGYVLPFKVQVAGESLILTPLPAEWLPGEWASTHKFTIVAGLALTAFLIWAGLRIARRTRNTTVAAPSSPASDLP